MAFRTNVLDSYHAGMDRQLATPDMQEMFPVWEYLGIRDGRQGKDHEPKFGKFYPGSASFSSVRGDRLLELPLLETLTHPPEMGATPRRRRGDGNYSIGGKESY